MRQSCNLKFFNIKSERESVKYKLLRQKDNIFNDNEIYKENAVYYLVKKTKELTKKNQKIIVVFVYVIAM